MYKRARLIQPWFNKASIFQSVNSAFVIWSSGFGLVYPTRIFGRMVKFSCLVRPSRQCYSAVRFLFIRPFGFGRLGHTHGRLPIQKY